MKVYRLGGPPSVALTQKNGSDLSLNTVLQTIPRWILLHATVIRPISRQCSDTTYTTMREPRVMIDELKETRRIMNDYPEIAQMPLHITEFNSSYSPLCPVHDTDFNAAFIARILS